MCFGKDTVNVEKKGGPLFILRVLCSKSFLFVMKKERRKNLIRSYDGISGLPPLKKTSNSFSATLETERSTAMYGLYTSGFR